MVVSVHDWTAFMTVGKEQLSAAVPASSELAVPPSVPKAAMPAGASAASSRVIARQDFIAAGARDQCCAEKGCTPGIDLHLRFTAIILG